MSDVLRACRRARERESSSPGVCVTTMAMETDVDVWVARRLKELRGERGITLTALAEQTGISAAHLSRLEKGERQPSIGSLLQIARVPLPPRAG
jgi:DNA-binding XRE family transcriptional regulator